MSPQEIDRFVAGISVPGSQAYAVIDTARGYRVHQAVRWSARPYQCLYRGQMPIELEQAAPYVVELGGDHHFTRKVLGDGWGDSWGFFAVAPPGVNLAAVRTHLRSLLRAKLEDGTTLLFRYYDPRVLRVYLPTCRPNELDTFFGPLTKIIVEDGRGGDAIVYERSNGALSTERMDLATG